MILPTCWRRRKGLSSFWLLTSQSAKSPQSWRRTSLCPRSPPPIPASPLLCPPIRRHLLLLPASLPSPQSPTLSSPAAVLPSLPPLSLAARLRWQTWSPPSWRSPWICWQRQKLRQHSRCQRSTCPTPFTRVRSGSRFMPQLILTLSPCAHLSWLALRPAPPIRLRWCLPSQRLKPSPLVALHTGGEATATISPLTPSAHQPCWPFKDSYRNNNSPYQAHSLDIRCADHRAMEQTCTRKQIILDITCLYLYLPITPM